MVFSPNWQDPQSGCGSRLELGGMGVKFVLPKLEDEPEMAKAVGVEMDEIVVLPEKLEMVARRIQSVSVMANTLASMYDISKLENG